MPRSAKPRKAYRPRLLEAPITDGLMHQFEEILRDAEIGLQLRAQTTKHFDEIAKAMNVVGPVALARLKRTSREAIAIRSAALAMNAAADRAAAGSPRMYDLELASVARGIDACKAALPGLSVRALHARTQQVERMMREGVTA